MGEWWPITMLLLVIAKFCKLYSTPKYGRYVRFVKAHATLMRKL